MTNRGEKKRKRHSKNCINCKKNFTGMINQKYCGPQCSLEWSGKKSFWDGIAPATVGAIQEYRVSIDLLKKGFEVYKSVSPSASCDLLCLKNNEIFTVEVKTCYETKNGQLWYPKKRIKAQYLALVLLEKIIYKPKLGG